MRRACGEREDDDDGVVLQSKLQNEGLSRRLGVIFFGDDGNSYFFRGKI